MFKEEEALALITAEEIIKKNKDKSLSDRYESAVIKIKAILKHGQKSKVEFLSSRIQVRNNRTGEKTSQYLIQLQNYISDFSLVKMEYRALSEELTERMVEPFALYTTNDNWVLIAYCRNRKDFRAFRLDRIQDLKPSSEKFEPHNMTLEQYLEERRKEWETKQG